MLTKILEHTVICPAPCSSKLAGTANTSTQAKEKDIDRIRVPVSQPRFITKKRTAVPSLAVSGDGWYTLVQEAPSQFRPFGCRRKKKKRKKKSVSTSETGCATREALHHHHITSSHSSSGWPPPWSPENKPQANGAERRSGLPHAVSKPVSILSKAPHGDRARILITFAIDLQALLSEPTSKGKNEKRFGKCRLNKSYLFLFLIK